MFCRHRLSVTVIFIAKGIFDEKLVSEGIVSAILKQKGYGTLQIEGKDWNSYKEEQYDQLADILRESLDMKAIYKMME